VAYEADFFEASEVFYRKTCLNSRGSAALVDGDDLSWGDSGGLLLGAGLPLAMSAQVGTLREGARGGGQLSCCVPARQLDWPSTSEGEAGGRG
jgi:hypothetical protein